MIQRRRKTQREPTIALINIVFLMLVFFLVAGVVAQPIDPDLNLVRTQDLKGTPPPRAIVIHPNGEMSVAGVQAQTVREALDMLAQAGVDFGSNPSRGAQQSNTALDDASATSLGVVRVVPDRDLDAALLVDIGAQLRLAGASSVRIVTEMALK